MQSSIDWKRIEVYLLQCVRNLQQPPENAARVLEKVRALSKICGVATCNRKMLQRIGKALLQDCAGIVVPTCPDYSHEQGRYTFRSLSGGVSLLATRHIIFLEQVAAIVPEIKPCILIADHEADDARLCQAVGVTQQRFRELVALTINATHERVAGRNWSVKAMTDHIPTLVEEEQRHAQDLRSTVSLAGRIDRETLQRTDMYRTIGIGNFEQMRERTILTAAQYLAFGHWAAQHHYLVCNHTTTNLSWYLQTEAALLHNEVSIY